MYQIYKLKLKELENKLRIYKSYTKSDVENKNIIVYLSNENNEQYNLILDTPWLKHRKYLKSHTKFW